MSFRRWMIATLSAWLAMVGAALLLHAWLFADFYIRYAPRPPAPPNFWFVLGGQLVLAALMAFSFGFVVLTGSWLRRGLLFGGFVGVVWRAPHALMEIGLGASPWPVAMVDSMNHLAEVVLGGVVIAALLRGPDEERIT